MQDFGGECPRRVPLPMAYRLLLRAPFLSRAACLRRLRLTPPGACLVARMSARACRDAERLSGDSRWVLMAQLRGSLCAATASRSSSSFFPISRLPRISGGRWRYTRGKQTISTSSVAPPIADQPLSDARQFARGIADLLIYNENGNRPQRIRGQSQCHSGLRTLALRSLFSCASLCTHRIRERRL